MNQELNVSIARKVLETVDHGLISGLGNPIPGQMCIEAAVCYAYGIQHSDNPPCVGKAIRAYKIALNDSQWSSKEARAKGMRAIAIAQLGSNILDQKEFTQIVAKKTIQQVLPKILRVLAGMVIFAAHQSALSTAANNCEIQGTVASADAARAAADAAAYAAAAAAGAAADAAAGAAYAAAYAARAAARAAAYAADAAADAAYAAAYAARAAAYAAAYAADAAAGAARAAEKDKWLTLGADICLDTLKEMNSPGCEYLYLLKE